MGVELELPIYKGSYTYEGGAFRFMDMPTGDSVTTSFKTKQTKTVTGAHFNIFAVMGWRFGRSE